MSGPFGRPAERPAAGAGHGSATIATLDALPPAQGVAVRMLRDWCEGPQTQAAVWNAFAALLGPAAGRAAVADLEGLVRLLVGEGRRPLMRHGRACGCVGADEAFFATLVSVAALHEREDAMMIAALILPASRAGCAADLARRLGLAIAQLCGAAVPAPPPARPAPGLRLH